MAASFLSRPWEEALDRALGADITHVEACGGGHIPRNHVDPVLLSRDSTAREGFQESVTSRGMTLSAISCHGNPLDPDASLAEQSHRDLIACCELAEQLGVPVVNALAGLPGGGPHDLVPNWIVPSVVPDFRDAYAWQWEERVLPYWSDAAAIARRHGVRIAIEPHPATVVYNGETFDRLREAVGDTVGMNYDPSHL
jgi:sugar phosphate isomerase/epimerase